MCVAPMKAFRTGLKTDNGKDDLYISPGVTGDFLNVKHLKVPWSMDAPHILKDGQLFLTDPIPIPCGNCVQCRMATARMWKNRAVLESIYAKKCWFITLTYDDEHLPFVEGEAVLIKRDLQNFFKRLRKRGISFRYLACGEYGENTHRPHFHFILFARNGTDYDFELIGVNLYRSDIVLDAWQRGNIVIQEACAGSIAYTAGYVEKKCKNDYTCHDYPPFRLASRKPGLGYEYYRDHCATLLDNPLIYGDFGTYKHTNLPQYFLYLLEKEDLDLQDFKDSRRLKGASFSDIEDCIYNLTDKEKIGYRKESDLLKSLQKKRIEKYDGVS